MLPTDSPLLDATDDAAVAGRSVDPRDLDASFWRETLRPYATPRLRRSIVEVLTSIVPYVALTGLMYWTLTFSLPVTLGVAVIAGAFAMRVFIIFHDCGHSSFFASRRANTWMGIVTGLLTYTAYHSWKHEHAVHHATAGDLDRRGIGDVDTWTVAEYNAARVLGRLGYRLMRNPVVLFGFGPPWALFIEPRLFPAWSRARFWKTILATDVAVFAMLGVLVAARGWQAVLVVQLSVLMVAGSIGIWMFYVQHQFEGVYWDRKESWSYAESALRGASYFRLPRLLQFFTGSIGFHHVHHLSSRIPNYNLERAHRENPVFHQVPQITPWQGVKTLRLKLYDEPSRQMVGFGYARDHRRAEGMARSTG